MWRGAVNGLWAEERIEILRAPVWFIAPEVAQVVAQHWDFFGPWSRDANVRIWVDDEATPGMNSVSPMIVYVAYAT